MAAIGPDSLKDPDYFSAEQKSMLKQLLSLASDGSSNGSEAISEADQGEDTGLFDSFEGTSTDSAFESPSGGVDIDFGLDLNN
jgi:hypothetical protein